MKEYLQSVADVLAASGSQKEGLTSQQVAKNLEKYGPNKLEEGKKRPLILRIWDQIKDPMVIILIIAAFISVISGAINGELSESLVDAVIIAVVVVLNACLGIFQESKAEKSIEALQKLSAPTTRVRRNGVVAIINSADIVPGDIVLLEAGDSVPADMRIIESASLKVEEAALTGESVPVEKQIDAITVTSDDEVPLGDRINMAYMGTNIAYGRGEGVVIGTGMNTEMGKIATILSSGVDEKTPLQIKLAGLSKFLSIAVLAICVLVFAVSLGKYAMTANGFDLSSIGLPQALESLLLAVSLAVAAIPEGLVVVVTIVLSIGVSRMSQRNSIIRRLTAVETLGCTQTICSDKTGTLTQNKMTVTAAYGDEKFLATAMSLCTDVQKDENGVYVGDPTEIALVDFNDKINGELPAQPRVGEAPFDSVRKKMSTVHDMGDGTFRQYTKGGLDEVLTGCTKIYKDGKITDITAADKEAILTENKSMAQRALRVLACSYRDYSQKPTSFAAEDLETDLIFVGIVGMIDPVRPEVKAAIEECNQAGIRAVMITGDHKDTAIAIAKELGILQDESQAITGAELSKMSDEEFEKRVKTISVYARVQPEHKVRIVTMWKKIGKITAMTGDGVNDAPAIKSADIGVGMGITGTDVTKNVADMVLTDDNFASIVYAVEEGRRIYENIRKAIQFLLSSNLAEVVAIFIATFIVEPGHVLLAPVHLLWINLVTDSLPAMALGTEPAEKDIMKQRPRNPREGIFANGLGIGVLWQGVLIGLLTLGSYLLAYFEVHGNYGEEQTAAIATTMAFITLSMCEIFHSINMRSRIKSIFNIGSTNKFIIGSSILGFILTFGVVYIPGVNDLMNLVPLDWEYVLTAFGMAICIIPIVEIVKLVQRAILKGKNK